jgi:hypothetical protein
MEKITVLKKPEHTEISVTIDGLCNHAGEHTFEDIDFGWADSQIGDWVDNVQLVEVCAKCGKMFSEIEGLYDF